MVRIKTIENFSFAALLLLVAVFEFAICKNAFGLMNTPVTTKLFRSHIAEIRIETGDMTSSLSKTNSGAWKRSGYLEDEIFSVLTSLTNSQMVAHRIDKESGEKILAERPLQLEAEFIAQNGKSAGRIMWLASKGLEKGKEDHGSGEVLLLKRKRDPNWYIVGAKTG